MFAIEPNKIEGKIKGLALIMIEDMFLLMAHEIDGSSSKKRLEIKLATKGSKLLFNLRLG